MGKKRADLTPSQIADAKRLKQVFKKRWVEAGRGSQTEFGEEAGGMTQGAVWQYINAWIPLNLEALLVFSQLLGVAPKDISPTLAGKLPSVPGADPAEALKLAAAAHGLTVEQAKAALDGAAAVLMRLPPRKK